jgi:hypothetical protein
MQEIVAFLLDATNSATQYSACGHQVQGYAAIKCSGMLPICAQCTIGPLGLPQVSALRHGDGAFSARQ